MSLGDWRHAARRYAASDDEVWIALALLSAATVYGAYLLTHPYPAYGAGLYLEIVAQIVEGGYALPERVPGYTAGGVPFAYPPLAFYLAAVAIDAAGVDPIVYARVVPGLLVLAYLVPYYGIARRLSGSPARAGVATVVLATAPTALRWHLSAGGMVRAFAFLLALSCIYAGIGLFETHGRRPLVLATATFGFTVLTHPTYTTFVVASYLVLFWALDRSARGLVLGAAVGIGGLVIAAPWWTSVAATHGLDIFTTAAGTHDGLGRGPYDFLVQLAYPLDDVGIEWAFYVLVYLGALAETRRRRWLLAGWLVVLAFAIGKNRFLFVPGGLLAATLAFDVLVPAIRARVPVGGYRRTLPAASVALLVLSATAGGVVYAAGAANTVTAPESDTGPPPAADPAQPQFVDEWDRRAMTWIVHGTAPDATFVALGDAAEWLPYLADRTILVGPWGVEWEDTGAYYVQVERFETISTCRTPACLTRALDRAGLRPTYVYVPKGSYTVRADEYVQSPAMVDRLEAADRYRIVYENPGVVVVEVRDADHASGDNR